MRPTLNLNFRKGAQHFQVALHSPMQGFDSLRIISQIISLQCLHYLILSMVIPPLLATLAFNQSALQYQGGATSLSMILDWREIAGVPVLDGGRGWPWNMYKKVLTDPQKDYLERTGLRTSDRDDMGGLNKWWEWDMYLRSDSLRWTKEQDEGISWSGTKRPDPGSGQRSALADDGKSGSVDPKSAAQSQSIGPYWWNAYARDRSRGWIIVLSWALTGLADVFLLSVLIRRPTHILDHTLTLHFVHLLLTTFYTRNLPTSLFYWLVMLAHAGACVVWAEALSIKRELRTGWISGWNDEEGRQEDSGDNENQEASHLLGQTPSMSHANGNRSGVTTHVLFEGDQDDDEDDDGHTKGGEKAANGHGHESIEMKRMK